MTFVRRDFLILTVLTMLGCSSPISRTAEAEPSPSAPSPAHVHEIVLAYGRTHDAAFDPAVEEAIIAGLTLFWSNLCDFRQSQGGERCAHALFDENVFGQSIEDYLRQLAFEHPSQVRAFSQRLADSIDDSMARAGWPEVERNDFGVVQLDDVPSSGQLFLQTATQAVALGVASHHVVLRAGRRDLRIRVSGSAERSLTALVEAHNVVIAQESPSATSAYVGDIEPSDALFCPDMIPERGSGPLERFNWGRALIDPSATERANHLVAFARQYAINIGLDVGSAQCDDMCKQGLGVAFAQSISVWRTGCDRCDANALVVVRVANHVWMDSDLASRLQRALHGEDIKLDLAESDATDGFVHRSPPRTMPGRNLLVSYRQIDGEPDIHRVVCDQPNPGGAPWFAQVQAILCAERSSGALAPVLRVVSADTSCGPSDIYIACGIPGGGVELTSDRIGYAITTFSGGTVLGDPHAALQVGATAVILHEVGHWFGVPHSEAAGPDAFADIMDESYGSGKQCVSSQALVMLNNAADDRWRWRVTSGGGLRRPAATANAPAVQPIIR